MVVLRVWRGVGPGYYHTAGFWRRGLRWADKAAQLSAAEYRRVIGRLNPVAYRKLSQNKVAEKAIISLFGLPTPRFIGRIAAADGLDREGRPLRNAGELAALIREGGYDRLVFKRPEGWGGKRVRIARLEVSDEIRCASLNDPDSASVRLPEYCESVLQLSQGSDWLVEEYFHQHPTMAQLNPGSVNTVRVWVLERSPAERAVVTAYARVGRGQMVVDNASSGGIVARIDPVTGTLGAAQDAHEDRRLYPHHPDHGAALEGVVVPYWTEVQRLAMRVLAVFPQIRFAGFDIAIGERGPVVLELNVSPDRQGAAFTDCPSARVLRQGRYSHNPTDARL